MKTLPLDLTDQTLEKLFQDGTCLTFNPIGAAYWKSFLEKEHEYKSQKNVKQTWIVPTLAPLCLELYNVSFHFFSNGVLIHAFNPAKNYTDKLKKF